MGRHSKNLHIGRRKSLRKLRREIFHNNRIRERTLNPCLEEKIEGKVIYCPSNVPNGVFYMEGILEIRPSVLQGYINELYKSKC